MKTVVSRGANEVAIGPDVPIVLIGEAINPTGKQRLAGSLAAGDMSRVQQLAVRQVEQGAQILDVNVGMAGVNEVDLLPMAVQAVMAVTDVPLCIDSANPKALASALKVYDGKALVNSVNGEEAKMAAVLPLVREHGAAVVALAMDDSGIPSDADGRLRAVGAIMDEAAKLGIPQEDLIVDCLAMSVSAGTPARATLEAMTRVRDELGLNQTVGASNISFGLPDRESINDVFLAMCLSSGVNAPIVQVAQAHRVRMVADLLMGHDMFGMNYVTYCRAKAAESKGAS